MNLHDKCKTATATGMNTELVNIQKGQKRIKTNKKKKKKKKRGEIHAELKVVEALNNSGQSNTQEKKMCSVLFNQKYFVF